MSTCPGCGAPMKHVEAGVSKTTGRPYEAFDACSDRCGFKLPKESGVRKILVESHKPSQVPQNGNDLRERTMVMSYAKDVVVKKIEVGVAEPGDSAHQIIAIYRELMSELTNPLGGV